MKRKWKIWLILIGVLVLAGGTLAGVNYSKRGIVEVQTGRVTRQDLASIVTASGEIKPRNYINIGTNAMQPSRITDILVKEGDRVKKGQLLARLEAVQPQADVARSEGHGVFCGSRFLGRRGVGQSGRRKPSAPPRPPSTAPRPTSNGPNSTTPAARSSSRTSSSPSRSSIPCGRPTIPAWPLVREAEARSPASQGPARPDRRQLSATQRRITQAQANLNRANDVLQKTYSVAPLDGVVTNLPVRVGETVVPGIQNSRLEPDHDHRRHVPHHRRSQGG